MGILEVRLAFVAPRSADPDRKRQHGFTPWRSKGNESEILVENSLIGYTISSEHDVISSIFAT